MALYFHTMRHLRPVQVWGRVVFLVRRPSPDLSDAPSMRAVPDEWRPPAERRSSMLGPRAFRFLNEGGVLPSGRPWEAPGRSKLWLYNLHYFDDLNAVGADERVDWHLELIERWIADNPPGVGVGWEPYPTSIRIVNWIKWAWAGNDLGSATRQSLAVQTRWLTRRLETHLLGNHLVANAKAMVFAGCYFEGPEARAWLKRGMTILEREIPEQILPDGGHFERSTMYHALALEDMLDLLNIARAVPAPFTPWAKSVSLWPEVVRRMGHWLSAMCHPDGEIAFFNDAATGIAPTPAALTGYARRLGAAWEESNIDGVVWLEHSGYVRAQRNGVVLVADVAPIGPDYLPAHAHADTLSFELSVQRQRVVVNSGTSCYGLGEQRDRERGTAAHSTVEVEGENSSEVWAGFRVARRARPFDVSVRVEQDAVRIEAAHDGYRRLRGGVVHRRSWELRDECLEIVDHLEGSVNGAISRVHFHPAVKLAHDRVEGIARWNGEVIKWRTEGCEPGIAASTWHPEFGMSMDCRSLVLEFAGQGQARSCRLVMTWQRSE